MEENFVKATEEWDLEELYVDLASAKTKRLTPTEKLYLRGLLCDYSPAEIAQRLQKNPKGVETDLCATLYKYVKNLVGKVKIDSWRDICEWLDEAGYKVEHLAKLGNKSLILDKSVVNIINSKIENNQVVFFIKLEVPTDTNVEIIPEHFSSNKNEYEEN